MLSSAFLSSIAKYMEYIIGQFENLLTRDFENEQIASRINWQYTADVALLLNHSRDQSNGNAGWEEDFRSLLPGDFSFLVQGLFRGRSSRF